MSEADYSFGVEFWDVTDFATLNDLQAHCDATGQSVLVDNGRLYISYTTEE